MGKIRTSRAPLNAVTDAVAEIIGDRQRPASARINSFGNENPDADQEGIRLGFLIHDTSRMRRSAYDQIMKPLGVTRAQWWVLAYLARHDGMMQTQLADVLEVGKASLGDVVGSLERNGWVERRSDPSDKRAKRVYLTKAGQPLIKRMMATEIEFNRKALADLSSAERAELGRSLHKIKAAVSRINLGANKADDGE
jgi:DNA-binding MarR family transcriptional regulator